jgi:phage terminase small subunit
MTCVQDILIVTMALMKARRRVKVMKRQKEMVAKEWNTVCSHGHAYDFFNNFPSECHKHIIDKELNILSVSPFAFCFLLN